jgi:hypothetical protein
MMFIGCPATFSNGKLGGILLDKKISNAFEFVLEHLFNWYDDFSMMSECYAVGLLLIC